MQIISFIALLAVILLKDVLGSFYEFAPDNDEIFEDCPKKPNIVGINEVFNITQHPFGYNDGSVTIAGNATCIWKGIEPTDRLMARSDLFKYQLGSWQPTLLSYISYDFCKDFLDKEGMIYQLWTSNILEKDQLCLNNYGHVYHHRPFTVNTQMKYAINMDGRYKIVVGVTAYDQMKVKREKSLCFQIPGTFYKVK